MKKRIIILVLISFCLETINLSAQYQSPSRIENYGGVSSIFINPANSSNFPLRWDLNLVSGDFYLDNSIGFITNTSLKELSQSFEDVQSGLDMEPQSDKGDLVADFYRDTTAAKYLQFGTTINGPAFLFNTNGGQSIGAFYNLRVMGGSSKIPGSLNYYNYISKSVDEWIDFPSVNFAFMAWDEIGVHFANRFTTANGYASAGINVKYLRGYEAGYTSLNNDTEVQFISSNQVEVSGLDFQYGFTNNNVDVVDNAEFELAPLGRGIGIDLGFNYVVEDDSDTYKLKLGASVNDIGGVTFRERAEVHGLKGNQPIIFDEATYQSFTSVDELKEQASIDLYGAVGLSELDIPLTIALPTTISLQADYKIVEYIYASALFVNRVSFSPNSVKATNLISVAPRFEHRWGMVSLPINIVEYQRVKMGAAVRLGYFIVGTDDLGSIVGTKEFRSTNVYFGIKANPFNMGSSSKGSSRNGASGKRGKVKCYKF